MLARAQTWWTILRICIEERLVYRGDFWLGTLMRFLPIVTQIFLWGAVFAGMEAAHWAAVVIAATEFVQTAFLSGAAFVGSTFARGAAGSQTIAGYSYHDFVAYYLLTTISRAFSS